MLRFYPYPILSTIFFFSKFQFYVPDIHHFLAYIDLCACNFVASPSQFLKLDLSANNLKNVFSEIKNSI